MADHTYTLTTTEEQIFALLLTMTGLTEQQAVDKFSKEPLKTQALQYINDACKTKIGNMTIVEKCNFLL